jgi:hypothetical protein
MATTAPAIAPTSADGELLLGLYRRMRLIRGKTSVRGADLLREEATV